MRHYLKFVIVIRTFLIGITLFCMSSAIANAQVTVTPTPGIETGSDSSRNAIFNVEWSPDGRLLLSITFGGKIQVWNRQNEIVSEFELDVLNNLTLAGWAQDSEHLQVILPPYTTLQFRDLQGNVKSTIDDIVIPGFSTSPIISLAWSPDRYMLAIAHKSGTIQLWDNRTKQSLSLIGHSDLVYSLAWSPDGRLLASGSEDKTVKIWNSRGQLISTLTKHMAPVLGVQWSYDGEFLLSSSPLIPFFDKTLGGNGTIILWHSDGMFVAQIDKGQIRSAHWQPTRDIVITANGVGPAIRFWNINGEFVDALKINAPIRSLSWSPDGNNLAFGAIGISIYTANGKTQLSQRTFPDTPSPIRIMAWSPDSKYLALGTELGQVKIWQVNLTEIF